MNPHLCRPPRGVAATGRDGISLLHNSSLETKVACLELGVGAAFSLLLNILRSMLPPCDFPASCSLLFLSPRLPDQPWRWPQCPHKSSRVDRLVCRNLQQPEVVLGSGPRSPQLAQRSSHSAPVLRLVSRLIRVYAEIVGRGSDRAPEFAPAGVQNSPHHPAPANAACDFPQANGFV